ncbi:MAG: PAS domain-containing protein [Gammaproteobacteria bacterium]|nr:PAS domain-containing protein [Gammaproteobacteria bacterium]
MKLSNEKPGFIMILASLLVMAITVYVLFDNQHQNREKLAQEQGLGLARLMSSISWSQLSTGPGQMSLLELFRQGQSNPDFAYGVIVDVNAQVQSEVTARGIIVPVASLPAEPLSWLNQRIVEGLDGHSKFIESHAPLFQNGELRGFVRLGYIKPQLDFSYAQMPFIATLTLPIFLLTPLFYFFLRQEMKPLRKINESIDKLTKGQLAQSVELTPSSEMSQFMERFNQFIDFTQARMQQLNAEQSDLVTSGKLLSYKNSKVESILQTMPEAILVIDKAGVVSYANQKIHSLLGLDPVDVINKKPHEWCKTAEVINILSGSHNKGAAITISSAAISSDQSGQDKKLDVRTYPLFAPTDDSKLLGRLVVIRDITEQHFEQQRQGEFVAQIAHELKTPLNVLSMYSESLLDDELVSEKHRIEAANVIHDEVERLSSLIQNLLSITKYELGGLLIERQRVRILDFLQDVFDNLIKSDRVKGVRFEIDLPREMSALFIDKALMRIAINNLMTNAIKYNKPGGLVTLEARESEHYIDISVLDEGYGISQQDQQHIFDKFFRSEDNNIREQTGHGLGLSLTQQIVQLHQGELSVKSTLGTGSQFRIRLDKDKDSMAGN